MASSITSANAVYILTVPGVFAVGQQLSHFAADNIFENDQQENAETQMGVDGYLSGGKVLAPVTQKIYLKADSPSCLLFEQWHNAEEQIKDVYIASANVTLPSVNETYVCTGGFMVTYSSAPNAKRVLEPRMFEIRWEKVLGQPLSVGAA